MLDSCDLLSHGKSHQKIIDASEEKFFNESKRNSEHADKNEDEYNETYEEYEATLINVKIEDA